ncbi:MFS transporter [Alphaproteobacteria bacterium]|nr:MFS transporter [Alphaproteobacteria bacterium]
MNMPTSPLTDTSHKRLLSYFMLSTPLLFFAFQFILRLWPGLMAPQIMEQFSIDAGLFGLLAAFYYYGYAGTQIFLALALDRYGARLTIFACAILCGVATLLFTYATSFWCALLSRFCIGVGSAIAFLGVSKVISEWFPKDQYTKLVGYSFTIGLTGAIYGGRPLSNLIDTYNPALVSVALAVASISIGFLTLMLLRSPASETTPEASDSFSKDQFKKLLTSPKIWLLAAANFLMVGFLEGFSDVWGVPYLITTFGLSKTNAAGMVSWVFVGMLFGGPVLAFCSKRWGSYPVIMACGFGLALISFALFSLNTYNPILITALLFVAGILCCYQVLVFAVGADLVAPSLLSVTIAFLNSINMLGGSFFHTLIGQLMNFFWKGTVQGSARFYEVSTYKWALSAIPCCALLGCVCIFWLTGASWKRKRLAA